MVRVLVLAVALCASGSGAGSRELERRFASELELATQSFELTGTEDGHTQVQQPPPQVREQADEIELTDTLLDHEDPCGHFTRAYRTVLSSYQLGAEGAPRTKTATAGLEGKTVTFEREHDGTYTRTCEDASVRLGQLKRLRAELSLACFLPARGADEESLEPGASWEIPSADLARLFSPLEEGPRRARPPKEAPQGALNLAPVALSVPLSTLLVAGEGSMTATLLASSAGDELPCNARLEFRLTSTFDGTESLLAGREGQAEDELELVYTGAGELAWDPASGSIQITCRGELRLDETFQVQLEGNGKTAEVRGKLAMAGTLELEGSEQRAE